MTVDTSIIKRKERKESRGETPCERLLNIIPTDNVPGEVFQFALHNTPCRIVISTHPVLLDASHNPCHVAAYHTFLDDKWMRHFMATCALLYIRLGCAHLKPAAPLKSWTRWSNVLRCFEASFVAAHISSIVTTSVRPYSVLRVYFEIRGQF